MPWRRPLLLAAALLSACGSGASPPAAPDFDLPTAISHGGPILAAPRVQAIYFDGFPYKPEMESFLAKLAASAYWPAIGAEYGVGALTVLPGYASTTAVPSALTADDTAALLVKVLTDEEAALGPPRADTMYTLFFSPATAITAGGGVLCQSGAAGGFHAEVPVSGTAIPFAVIPTCKSFFGSKDLMGADVLTPAVSHELIEVATDPFPTTQPAFLDTDPQHVLWGAAFGAAEIADLCENEHPNLLTPDDLGFPVQRIWSNASARAGDGPCVPVPAGEIYFDAVGRLPDLLNVTIGNVPALIPALRATVGGSATITADLRGHPGGPASWQVFAVELHGDATMMGHAVPGRRGEAVQLGVAAPDATKGIFPLVVASQSDAALHLWVGAIERR